MHRNNLGGTVTAIAYITLSVNAPVSFNHTPAFTLTFPTGTLSGYAYVAFYSSANASAGWNAILGPVSASGTSLSFAAQPLPIVLNVNPNTTNIYAIVETGTPLPTPTPTPTPTPIPTPTSGGGTPLSGPANGPNGGWGPTAIANALQFPVQSGFNGAGWTVAIVIDSNILTSDLNTYLAYFQITTTNRTISVKSVDGGSGVGSDQSEATLDAETVAGLAPGANIIIYQIPALTTQYGTDAYNQIISDGQAFVVSSSAGGCEFPGVNGSGLNTVIQQGAQNGIVFVASSGDQGNECFSGMSGNTPTYAPGVTYPASDPNSIGVGGTETVPPQYTLSSTVVWNDFTCQSGQCAGGGGVSGYFPIPTYQQNLPGVASAQARNVPDVSMPAVDDAIYENGSWQLLDGTSWSAPQFAAMIAEVYEYCNSAFQTPVTIPYYVFSNKPSAFIDVTSGNDQFGGTTPYYSASPGYDDASGIGVPFGMLFANTVCPNRVPVGFLRRPRSFLSYVQRGPAQARTLDVTPRTAGLLDQGERPATAQTRIQLVLRPTASIASDEQTVTGILRQAGFTIVQTFPNHLVIDAQAPSGTVESFFGTQMHDVLQGSYDVRYMPVRPVVLPASLAPYVAGINLDSVITMHPPR